MKFPKQVKDAGRLAALADFHILDTAPEQGFDDIVHLAREVCQTPVALVSLVAEDRQWFKARVGFPDCETDLNSSVCAFALVEPDMLIIPDLSVDQRTSANPLVTHPPHIRFYAGAPLRTAEGHTIGSLCVIDTEPRPNGLTEAQIRHLKALANQVMIQLSMRRAAIHREEVLQQQRATVETLALTEEQLRLAINATQIGIFDFNLVTGELRWDARVRELFGVASDAPVTYAQTFLMGVHPDDRAAADAAVQEALDPAGSGVFDTEYRVVNPGQTMERWLGAKGQAILLYGKVVRFVGTVRDITNRRSAEIGLQATEERYRLAVRATNDAIWDWDLVTNEVLWNEALTTAHGYQPAEVVSTGDWWIEHIHPDDRERVSHSIHDVIDGAQDIWSDTYRFRRADGSFASIRDRGFVIRDASGKAVRMIGAMLDGTEQMESDRRKSALVALGDQLRDLSRPDEMIKAASEVVGHTLDVARAGFGYVSDDFESIEIANDWTKEGTESVAGLHTFSDYGEVVDGLKRGEPLVVGDVLTEPKANAASLAEIGIRSMVNAPISSQGKVIAVMFVHDDKSRLWSAEVLDFLRNVGDRLEAGIARLKAEGEQRVLNEELSHRMKNTMAMIQAIATQTLKDVPDQAPVQAFNNRLLALSNAHDVLLKRSWMAAPVMEVARSVLTTFGTADRFHFSGPNVQLGARATLSLSLLLHELATNAVKYGSISTIGGDVDLDWTVDVVNEVESLVFHWRERGGPAPHEPDQRGFGSRLIRMGLIGTGQVELRYPSAGFEADFFAPLNQVQQ